MTLKKYITILFILTAAVCHAGPARPGTRTLKQPDGSSFSALVKGDEFMKVITTTEGSAIIKDSDGWWCYATYGSDGTKCSSGHRVGGKVSSEILGASRMIPYDVLVRNASAKRDVRRMKTQSSEKPEIGTGATTKHGIVILAEYADVKFKYSRQDFIDMLTKEGYDVGDATGCAKEYFDSQFHGMFDFEFQVSEIVTLDGVRAYYGGNDFHGNDKRPAEMIAEACRLADDDVDFSLYDDNDDGYVDNVFVFFAGEDEADYIDNPECIWSHSWYITSGAELDELILDGKIIDQYACTSELMHGMVIAGIGTFCHEFSHTLGLPDFYDTDYEGTGGWAAGLWNATSLMDGGNVNNNCNTPPYYNALEREITGLSEPIMIEKNGTYTLEPIHDNGKYYRLDTDQADEYYLFECRTNEGWDKYIGGSGMLVYHIDKTSERAWEYNIVNTRPTHQNADLIEADGRTNSLNEYNYAQLMGNLKGLFFPYNKVNSLTAETTPGLKFWSGNKCGISVTNIRREGRNITFSVSGFEGEEPPLAVNLTVTSFMDAAIIRFESDRPYSGEATVTWKKTGGEDEDTVMVSPYEEGRYSLTLEGLEPGNKTYSISVRFDLDGISGETSSISFMTSRAVPVKWPYIHLGKIAVKEDGTIPAGTEIALRVYNGTGAEDINWSYNDMVIKADGNGFFTVNESGVLRAYVYWEDGSVDILEKKINISSQE